MAQYPEPIHVADCGNQRRRQQGGFSRERSSCQQRGQVDFDARLWRSWFFLVHRHFKMVGGALIDQYVGSGVAQWRAGCLCRFIFDGCAACGAAGASSRVLSLRHGCRGHRWRKKLGRSSSMLFQRGMG